MPVGTVGSVKAIDATDLAACGATIMLSNTYHLLLRPGPELISRLGGLHKFINSPLPVLTDSGGFQVMSLSSFRKLSEKGVTFKSHLDGSIIELTPEEAARVQNLLGVDIQMMLDVCPHANAEREEVVESMELSLKWADRFLESERPDGVLRFGIPQGGFDPELRTESTIRTAEKPFDGFGIGGLSVGEPEEVMYQMLDVTLPLLPENRPRYLMGVGKPSQIVNAVARGVDMFDCVLPTRIARHGTLWTQEGIFRVNRAENAEDPAPPSSSCSCLLCSRYSRAYLRHIFRLNDPLYFRLATIHNLTFTLRMMSDIRDAIEQDTFADFLKSSPYLNI